MLGDGVNVLGLFGDNEFEVAAQWKLKLSSGRKKRRNVIVYKPISSS